MLFGNDRRGGGPGVGNFSWLGILRLDIPGDNLPVIPIFRPQDGNDLAGFAGRLEPEDRGVVPAGFLCFARGTGLFVVLQGFLIVALELGRDAVRHAVDPKDISILLLNQRQAGVVNCRRFHYILQTRRLAHQLDWWQPCLWRQRRERSQH